MESDVIVFLSCGSEHPDCIFDIALDPSSRSFILKPIFCEKFEIAAVQKDANLVEL